MRLRGDSLSHPHGVPRKDHSQQDHGRCGRHLLAQRHNRCEIPGSKETASALSALAQRIARTLPVFACGGCVGRLSTSLVWATSINVPWILGEHGELRKLCGRACPFKSSYHLIVRTRDN